MSEDNVPCWVYRSTRHPETYLYLSEEDAFEQIPEGLLEHFGDPVLVIELELNPDRKLAREDVIMVMCNLRTQGYHLQLPPELKPHLNDGDS